MSDFLFCGEYRIRTGHLFPECFRDSKRSVNKKIALTSDSIFCGEYRIRTGHLLHAMQALYQMS